MPFDQGSITCRVCLLPESMPEDALERFSAKAAGSLESIRDEPVWGWVARHLLETRIDEETAYRGGYLTLTLRQAQRKIPASLLRAECRMEEISRLADREAEGLSRKEKKEIKAEVSERLLPKMPPQIGGVPFVVDDAAQRLYVGASSDSQLDQFLGFFRDTVGFEPIALTAEVAATDLYSVNPDGLAGLNVSPSLTDNQVSGTLGRDFLTWLWWYQDENEGKLPKSQLGEFGFLVDGPLVFVAEGPGAHESAIRKGLPTLSAEAKAALEVGKKLKQAKLVVSRGNEMWNATLDADTFAFRSLRLPDGEALDPDSTFLERVTNLHIFQALVYALLQKFIASMSDADEAARVADSAKAWVRSMDGK
mgnify:CR=1 FL=1